MKMMLPTLHKNDPINLLRREMDCLFEDFFPKSAWGPSRQRQVTYPAFNAWEKDHEYFVEAECPGYAIGDLEISVIGNQLTIAGKSSQDGKNQQAPNDLYHRRERSQRSFQRVLTLPSEVDATKVDASLKDGVLTIKLPKTEAAKPRKITVKSH